VDGSGGHNETWVNVDEGVILPDDVYVVPAASDFAGLAIVGSESAWNTKVHSEWEGEAQFNFGGKTSAYAYVSFTPRGTTSSGKIALAVAEPQPNESGDISYRFINPNDVVGLRMRPYGSYVLLSSIHDF